MKFKSKFPLRACGIDAERVGRFDRFVNDHDFMPTVFTSREIARSMSLSNPATGLCASFCCKEALFKALSEPYNYINCEFFYSECGNHEIKLAPLLINSNKIYDVQTDVLFENGIVVVKVFLF